MIVIIASCIEYNTYNSIQQYKKSKINKIIQLQNKRAKLSSNENPSSFISLSNSTHSGTLNPKLL